METVDNLSYLKSKLNQFRASYMNLLMACEAEENVNEFISADYPFEKALNDMDIMGWIDKSVNNINKELGNRNIQTLEDKLYEAAMASQNHNKELYNRSQNDFEMKPNNIERYSR